MKHTQMKEMGQSFQVVSNLAGKAANCPQRQAHVLVYTLKILRITLYRKRMFVGVTKLRNLSQKNLKGL